MTPQQLIDFFTQHNAQLHLVDGNIKCRAPKGFLTEERVLLLKQMKPQLISLLTDRLAAEGPKPRTDDRASFPLSHGQRQLWYLQALEPENPFYNNPITLFLDGKLDIDALQGAIDDLMARHESLRTCFVELEGTPVQQIKPHQPFQLTVSDLRHLGLDAATDQAVAAARADARTAFDLSGGALLRSRLWRLSDNRTLWHLNLHHIAADGWSIGLLFDEMSKLYSTRIRNQPSPLPALEIQYADFALWQSQTLGRERLQEQAEYWKTKLADAPPLLDLPTDRPRPPVQIHTGAHCHHDIPEQVAGKLRSLCREIGVSPFSLFMTAFSLVLARYSRQDDILVGTPFAGRNLAQLEPMIGHFINSLVIRNRITPETTAETLIQQTHASLLEAMEHQDLPFEHMVEAVNPERDPAYSPLFQVMMIYQNIPGGGLSLDGLSCQPVETDSATAKYDITLEVFDSEQGLRLGFEYNSHLFDADRMQRMARHIETALTEICLKPKQAVQDIRILTQEERAEILNDWSHGEPCDGDHTFLHHFQYQVTRQPDATALVWDGGTLCYQDLDSASDRLAADLISRKVRTGDPVGILMERSPEQIVAILGILKAGAAFLPLPPDHPVKRLSSFLAESGCGLILCHEGTARLAGELSQNACQLMTISPLKEDWLADGKPRTDDPVQEPPHITADSIAYIIQTSGSTGQPKGIDISHRALGNLVRWSMRAFPAHPGDGMLQKTPCGFDAAIWEFFWPLAAGSRLVIAGPDGHQNPAQMVQMTEDHAITDIQFVPQILQLFLDALKPGQGKSLRRVYCGGGVLTIDLLHQFQAKLPEADLVNVYGPAEACVNSLYHIFPAGLSWDHPDLPVGRPVDGAHVYILDPDGQPVPAGVDGEIHMAGIGLANGYRNRPDLTEERFVPARFDPGERLYRTGDLGHFQPDGTVFFSGRADFQIKLNGQRLEPGEIESALRQIPGIQEASVVLVQREIGAHQLAAVYQTSAPSIRYQTDELEKILGAHLPRFMIPQQFIPVDKMPLNSSGKPDRKAVLKRAEESTQPYKVNLASPRDHVELTIYNIWKRVLLHPSIGIDDSFFHVGGSSIAAIKVVHAIEEHFGIRLPVRDFITMPTIQALGGWIRDGAKPEQERGNLVQFRAGTGRKKVICIHPAGGTAFCYLSLAKILPEEIGVIGVQSPGLNEGEEYLPGIPAMAENYLNSLDLNHDCDIILTGLSFGGYVAYEMARLLRARGHHRTSVILLDTQGTDDPTLRNAMAPVEMAEFRDKLIKFNGMYPGIDDGQIERYFHVYNHNRMSVPGYDCPAHDGRVVFVQAMGNHPRALLHELRKFWRDRTTDMLVTLVRGDHWELLETEEINRVASLMKREFDLLSSRSSAPATTARQTRKFA
ncbi:non-ribosomal peptide synthetase [Aestuariispira insulae]|uniref:Amino acid adenylation domain-containing protein n=1 Tax=Aestuariispira insulae TaxID=1461337 RepID=A0A3D9HA44_9PROT|nr:non-ribosomal peptide synthetase [Aestuariispira insulae]RED45826.1 amino acid adenylation domain-containing protein [Aestuariispira insulae]